MRQRAKLAMTRAAFIQAVLVVVLLALVPAIQLLRVSKWGCSVAAMSADTENGGQLRDGVEDAPAGRFAGERLLAGSFAEEWDSFRYRDKQPNGSSCAFLFHSVPVKQTVGYGASEHSDICDQDESCVTQFDRVCLTRKDSKVPIWNASSYEYGEPVLEVSQLPFECIEEHNRAKLFGSGSCGRMGKRLPVRVLADSENGVKAGVSLKPSTFIIYCAQEGCDYNVFHSIALAYYPTYVALQKLGLKNLEGWHVEFYECQAGKPNEVKTPKMIAAARERHATFIQAFKPASIEFIDVVLQAEVQQLGCYERVAFVGQTVWPWHCKTTSTEEDFLLTGFAEFLSEALGLGGPASLPAKDQLLYFKRDPQTVRTILNSDDVEKAFPVDYSVYVAPNPAESYKANLMEIVEKARGASIIFGMHGAGLTNAIFAPRDSVVIEVVNCYFRMPLYRNLAVLTGKFYIEVVVDVDESCKALAPDKLINFQYHGDHVTVLLNDLVAAFDQARIILHRVRSLSTSLAEQQISHVS